MNGGIISNFLLLLDLVRAKNIAFVVYLQFSFFWLLTKIRSYDIAFCDLSGYTNNELFLHWIIPVALVMALGNITNDYYDYQSDIQNQKRPSGRANISRVFIFRILILIALSNLTYLVFLFLSDQLIAPYIIISSLVLIVFYSVRLKCMPVIGNVVVGLLSCLSLYPYLIQWEYVDTIQFAFCFGFIVFVFMITLIREIVKDLEDVSGDRLVLCETLPVKVGEEKTKLTLLGLFMATSIGLSIWVSFFTAVFAISLILLTIGPLFFVAFQVVRTNDYGKISLYLKLLMISSSLLIFSFGLQYTPFPI